MSNLERTKNLELTPGTDLGGIFPQQFDDEYITMARGEGHRVFDSAGNEYVDAVAGSQNVNIGHGRPEIAEAARAQMATLEFTPIRYTTEPAMEFTERIVELTPDGFEHAWLVSGGTLANESAVKMAYQYHEARGDHKKRLVVSRRNSYHGNTVGAMSWSGFPAAHAGMDLLGPHSPTIPHGSPYRCDFCEGDGGEACGVQCANELERTIQHCGPENVAAFIAEPVSGATNAGSYPHDGYFQRIKEICEEYDVLFIADEVLTGVGRTGETFAMEHWDVDPHIITAGKGLTAGYAPMGATIPHESVVDVYRDEGIGFNHGHTYSFNAATAAIGSAVLEYTDEHDLVENAREVGAYMRERLEDLYSFDWVGDVRGKGMMQGIEFVGDRETKEPLSVTGEQFQQTLHDLALEEGVLTDPGGYHVDGERGDHVLIAPPLTVTKDDVDELVDRLTAGFERTEAALDLGN